MLRRRRRVACFRSEPPRVSRIIAYLLVLGNSFCMYCQRSLLPGQVGWPGHEGREKRGPPPALTVGTCPEFPPRVIRQVEVKKSHQPQITRDTPMVTSA